MPVTCNAARTVLSSLSYLVLVVHRLPDDTVAVKGPEGVRGWSSFRVSGSYSRPPNSRAFTSLYADHEMREMNHVDNLQYSRVRAGIDSTLKHKWACATCKLS